MEKMRDVDRTARHPAFWSLAGRPRPDGRSITGKCHPANDTKCSALTVGLSAATQAVCGRVLHEISMMTVQLL